MGDNEKTILVVAAIGIAWLLFSRNVTVTAPVLQNEVSTFVPFYLNYNTASPVMNAQLPVLPQAALDSGISLFGTTYGSQY